MNKEDFINLDYKYKGIDKKITINKSKIKGEYNQNSLFTLLVEGESMQTLVKDKSVVVADLSQKEVKNNSLYIIEADKQIWIKKASKDSGEFISINEAFKNHRFFIDESRVIAKVIYSSSSDIYLD